MGIGAWGLLGVFEDTEKEGWMVGWISLGAPLDLMKKMKALAVDGGCKRKWN